MTSPASMLNQYINGIDQYIEYTTGTKDDLPWFTCTLTYNGIVAVGEAKTKKDAKQVMSKDAIEKIRHQDAGNLSSGYLKLQPPNRNDAFEYDDDVPGTLKNTVKQESESINATAPPMGSNRMTVAASGGKGTLLQQTLSRLQQNATRGFSNGNYQYVSVAPAKRYKVSFSETVSRHFFDDTGFQESFPSKLRDQWGANSEDATENTVQNSAILKKRTDIHASQADSNVNERGPTAPKQDQRKRRLDNVEWSQPSTSASAAKKDKVAKETSEVQLPRVRAVYSMDPEDSIPLTRTRTAEIKQFKEIAAGKEPQKALKKLCLFKKVKCTIDYAVDVENPNVFCVEWIVDGQTFSGHSDECYEIAENDAAVEAISSYFGIHLTTDFEGKYE